MNSGHFELNRKPFARGARVEMPEVHVIGEIQGATGFPDPSTFCRWKIVSPGDGWELLEGADNGHTQTDCPADGEFTVYAHPVDVHYKVSKLTGWPKLSVQVWHQDSLKRNELCEFDFALLLPPPCFLTHPLFANRWQRHTKKKQTATAFATCPPVLGSTRSRL
jgi:B9 domain-containing protein 2